MVLEPRLLEKHNAKPVHTRQEISAQREVSNNIRQFSAYYDGNHCRHYDFRVRKVVKSQYGATTKKGEEMRALIFYSSI
jgi:hypothetical protein